jgi:hypothetical protein
MKSWGSAMKSCSPQWHENLGAGATSGMGSHSASSFYFWNHHPTVMAATVT